MNNAQHIRDYGFGGRFVQKMFVEFPYREK